MEFNSAFGYSIVLHVPGIKNFTVGKISTASLFEPNNRGTPI